MSGLGWNHIKEDLQASSKQKLSGLEGLEALLKRTSLEKAELAELIDLSPSLLSDANSKVALQTLEALATAVSRADAPVSSYASSLVPFVAERLGDSRQPIREQALHLLTSLFKTLKPELVLDKLAPLWQHKSWKVKQGLLEVIAEVVSTSGASFLGGRDQNNAFLKQVVRMMEEPEMIVREAALGCLAEIHRQAPAAVMSTVQASNLRPVQQKEVLARLGVGSGVSEGIGADIGGKRAHAAYTSDTATSSSGGGYYLTPELTAPVITDAKRGSVGGQPKAVEVTTSWGSDVLRQSATLVSASQGTASVPAKRGGFKDGGGMTFDGELPPATPVPIHCERDLRMELEAATATLAQAPNADWQARMTAMQRVEGLVLGGAVDWECFHEAMKGLAQALSQQFKERRSTIARQACHLIGVLARTLGPRFEPHAITLLPTLLGVLVITVAVMAESADVGVRGILQHCQTGRLLQVISDTVCREKNPKMRQFCVSFLVQILEDWDVSVWSRQMESLEAAIRAAAQDSSAETRQLSRTAMALYHGAQPDRAQAFLKRLDGSLQEKLAAGLSGTKPAKASAAASSRQTLAAAIAATKRLARQAAPCAVSSEPDILVIVPTGPKSEQASELQRTPFPSRLRSAMRPSLEQSVVSTSGDALSIGVGPNRPRTASLGCTSRKSLGLPPGRIPGGSADLTVTCDSATQARLAALRLPRTSVAPHDFSQRFPLSAGTPATPSVRSGGMEGLAAARVPVAQTPERHMSSWPVVPAVQVSSHARTASSTQQDRASASEESGTTPAPSSGGLVPLARVISTILAGPRTWSDKVDAFSALTAHVKASVPSTDVDVGGVIDGLVVEPERISQALVRVREVVLESLEDPHHKVLMATLSLLRDVVLSYGNVVEGQLDRLLPLLLSKGAEAKEQVRTLCYEVLCGCGVSFRPEVLVPALSKCLDVVKLPRGKQTALEFFKEHMDHWGTINSTILKSWLVRLAPLLDDRTPELRKRAAEVLDALLSTAWAREPIHYIAYQHNSPDVGPLRKYLAAFPAPGPTLQVTGNHSWSNGSALHGHPTGLAEMAITGTLPATTSDSRRQLPSAVMSVPLPSSGTQLQAVPSMGNSDHGHASSVDEPLPERANSYSIRQAWSSSPSKAPGYCAISSPVSQKVAVTQRSQPQSSSCSIRPPVTLASTATILGDGTTGTGNSAGGHYVNPASPSPVPRRPLLVPQEPNAQMAYLSRLVDAARTAVGTGSSGGAPPGVSKDQQAAAMEDLADAIQQCSKDAWVRTFPLVMVEVSSWVQQPAFGVRTWAYWLLKELLLRQPQLFTDNNLESQISLLLQGCGDSHRDVVMTAGQALQILLLVCNERHAMLLLQHLLQREREVHLRARDKGARVVAILDGIRQLINRFERSELQRITFQAHSETRSTLLQALVVNLADPETCVRRSAVLTSAGLWHRLGHGVRDALQEMAAPSFNLLCIYYLKLQGVMVDAGQQDVSQHLLVQGTRD